MNNIYLSQNQLEPRLAHLKRVGIIAATVILLGFLFFWLYGHSFISVSVESPIKGEVSYELVDQNTKKRTTITTASSSIRKFVKKSDYEVLVKNQETSSFSVATTKSFLRTTAVSAKLLQEKKREFVGDNPGPCMYFDQILFTYDCQSDYSSLSMHLPASLDSPTVTSNPEGVPPGLPIGGIFKLNGKSTILLSEVVGGEGGEEEPTRLYDLRPDLQLLNYVSPPELDPESSYLATAYAGGALIYDESFETILNYKGDGQPAEKINIPKPENQALTAQQLSVDGGRISLSYSSPDKVLEEDEGNDTSDEETAVQIYDSGQTKSFSFSGSFYVTQLCGVKYLCLVQERELVVYDVSSDEAKEVARVVNVYNIKTFGNKLLIMRYDGVLEFDIESRTGYMQYSLGEYTPCGIEIGQDNSYVLCLINPKNDKVALRVEPSRVNDDSIDKKLLKLLGVAYVSTVSAYGSFIYISPELGEPVYDSNLKAYVPDPEIKQKTAADINRLIDDVGINRSVYQVINTQP